jgi:hypothetical protein
MFIVEFCIRRSPPTIVLGNPVTSCRSSRQVGAFTAIAIKDTTDLKINIICNRSASHGDLLRWPKTDSM